MGINDRFQEKIDLSHALYAEATWDAASIGDGNEEAKDVTVEGARIGDFVQVAASIDITDLSLVGQVTASNTVTVQLGNWTGGAINLGSMTVRVLVQKVKTENFPIQGI